jgi:hypothetical protein
LRATILAVVFLGNCGEAAPPPRAATPIDTGPDRGAAPVDDHLGVTGAIDKVAVLTQFEEHHAELGGACGGPPGWARVDVAFDSGASPRVTVAEGSLAVEAAECVVKEVGQWSWPRPEGPASARLVVVFRGDVVLQFASDDVELDYVEVRCPAFQERGYFRHGGSATVRSVPSGQCTAKFGGGPPYRMPVVAGQTYACTMDPLECKAASP